MKLFTHRLIRMRCPIPHDAAWACAKSTHHLLSHACLATLWLLTISIVTQSVYAADSGQTKFRRISTQYIAALGDPGATSGNSAQLWGLWPVDPGPRGVKLNRYHSLKDAGGVAPARWMFDEADWWLEEHGLIMENPTFPLAAGQYLVTGDREVRTVLTVHPKDKNGNQRWELADGATLYDVTHLGCRAARYTPAKAGGACSPANVSTKGFPMTPNTEMPSVSGCNKQDYPVLIVVGVPAGQ